MKARAAALDDLARKAGAVEHREIPSPFNRYPPPFGTPEYEAWIQTSAFPAFTETHLFSWWLTTPDGEAFAQSEFGWGWTLQLARDCRRFLNEMMS